MRPRRRVFLAVIVAVGAVVPAVPSEAAEKVQIQMAATQFAPQVVEVPAGSGVEWVNLEATNYPGLIGNHNIVADSLTTVLPDTKPFPAGSALIPPGKSWACNREARVLSCKNANGETVPIPPGRYSYMCGIHPNQMHGILVVA